LSRIIVLGVFTAPWHISGRGADHIQNSLSVVEACLPSRCLAMGIHVTVLFGRNSVSKELKTLHTNFSNVEWWDELDKMWKEVVVA
jgi:hypothetical protein